MSAEGAVAGRARAVHRVGTRAVLVDLADLGDVMTWHAALSAEPLTEQRGVVAAASTILLTTNTPAAAADAFAFLRDFAPTSAARESGREITLDVVYDGEDLAALADGLGLTPDSLIEKHTAETWTGAFGGFAPGFTYCIAESGDWDVPRRDSPRTAVPPGSVALAGEFSAVYPRRTPGGWQLIGRTDTPMWDESAEPPALPIAVSAPARELIEIALRKDPGNRFRDGNEFQLAIAQVRQGLRPAQPGGNTQVVAMEPSATASTQMLASVADERTARPEGSYPPSAAKAPVRAANPTRNKPVQEKKSSAGPIVATLLGLALLGVGAAWAYTSGAFDRFTGTTTPTPTPTVATQTEVEDEETETETVETTTHHERTTITETHAPGTLRFDEPPEHHQAPEPAPVEPEPEQPAPVESTPAPVSSASVAPETTQKAPAPAPDIELPNLENLLGGGR